MVDTTEKSLTLSASINVNGNYTVYGVGLYTKSKVYNTAGNYVVTSFLLFYDHLSSPFNVTQGDVVTVVYKIVAP